MQSFEILSDIHLEFYNVNEIPYLKRNTNMDKILLLAGDIGNPTIAFENYWLFLADCSTKYKMVFIIKGNHEYYYSSIDKTNEYIICLKNTLPNNIIFMDKTRFDINEYITILGCTLWSNIQETQKKIIKNTLNDFVKISDWTIERAIDEHRKDVNWLKKELSNIDERRKVIILTHHAPLLDGTSNPKYDNSPIKSAFASDLRYMMQHPITYWCFGHTHYCSEQKINDVRVISWQKGYPDEKYKETGFKKKTEKIFIINNV